MGGSIAALALITILIQSSSAIHRAFYEVFIHLHIALNILVLVLLWFHIDGSLHRSCLLAWIIAWLSLRLLRLVTFITCNLGREGTKATVEVLTGGALRLAVSGARKMQSRPVSYFYLYVPSVGLWTSLPFSIAWSDMELPLG